LRNEQKKNKEKEIKEKEFEEIKKNYNARYKEKKKETQLD